LSVARIPLPATDPMLAVELAQVSMVCESAEHGSPPSLVDRLGVGAASHLVSLLTMRAPLR